MTAITYKQVGIDIRVYVDKSRSGTIRRTTAGWVYYPKNSKVGGEPNHSLDAVKRSLETDEPAPPVFKPIIAGQFETFDAWVARASHTIAENYCPTDTVGYPLRAICVDAKGRRCQCGGDFMRARDENAFPVVYFWEFENGK